MLSASRRTALKGLLGLSAAAVAAQFGVSEQMAKDIQNQLSKDLSRTTVAMPGQTMLDKQEIWYSVADVAHVWARELGRQNPAIADDRRLIHACTRMARAIDYDLQTARVGKQDKVIVEIPKLILHPTTPRTRPSLAAPEPTQPAFELRAGVVQKATLWTKRTHIGYLQEEILVGEAVNEARRGLFGLK